MKKYLAALSVTTLISSAPYALAASSTDLTVKGTITPSACTPGLSDGGTINVGKIPVKNLNLTSTTEVGRYPLQLTVACNAARQFALNNIDNRATTSLADNYFGLGLTKENEKIGMFRPNIKSALGDGKTVYPIAHLWTSWKYRPYMGPNEMTSASATMDYLNNTPLAVKNLTMELEVIVIIDRADKLTLTQDVPLDGSATFELKYI